VDDEVVAMHERYFTQEQRAALARRREELGQDAIAAAEREWADLIARVRAERDAGTDPSDPRVRALAARWQELVEAFTGGDEGIRSSLGRMYVQEGPERASRGMLDEELMAYIGRAFAG
jgi:MerR family transcriptional regulator, thiopeptide resistance regulator